MQALLQLCPIHSKREREGGERKEERNRERKRDGRERQIERLTSMPSDNISLITCTHNNFILMEV